MAPNVFHSRFKEIHKYLEEKRAALQNLTEGTVHTTDGKRYLRAQINEERALLTAKVRELFGIEYFYYVDREDASELLTAEQYAAELGRTYDELEETINAIFMYKEENAYTVARRIEDLNILMHEMDKFRRRYERIIH